MIDNYELKLSAYADDADFLVADGNSIKLVFQMCRSFQEFSSLKLNLEKSEACWVGHKKGYVDEPVRYKWVNIKTGAIRTLGIFNSYDSDLVDKLNFLDNLKMLK